MIHTTNVGMRHLLLVYVLIRLAGSLQKLNFNLLYHFQSTCLFWGGLKGVRGGPRCQSIYFLRTSPTPILDYCINNLLCQGLNHLTQTISSKKWNKPGASKLQPTLNVSNLNWLLKCHKEKCFILRQVNDFATRSLWQKECSACWARQW